MMQKIHHRTATERKLQLKYRGLHSEGYSLSSLATNLSACKPHQKDVLLKIHGDTNSHHVYMIFLLKKTLIILNDSYRIPQIKISEHFHGSQQMTYVLCHTVVDVLSLLQYIYTAL